METNPTATNRPRTILAVETYLRSLMPQAVADQVESPYPFLFGMATVKLAEANREIERLEGRPERLTVACAGEGNCYETAAYDAHDLAVTSLDECLGDDGWQRTDGGRYKCPACVALDGPGVDRAELPAVEGN